MPVVVFECPGLPLLEVTSPGGARLVDLCDEKCAGVPFSCRSASCGTCRIDVLSGPDRLEPPGGDELEILDLFGDDPGRRRLACQARIRAGAGCLRIRPVDD
jgi:ferredoxin